MKIFSGSFGGPTLWDNPNYVSPAKYRQQISKQANYKYINRVEQKIHAEATRPKTSYKLKPLDDIFAGDPLEKAKNFEKPASDNEENDDDNDETEQNDTSDEVKPEKTVVKKSKTPKKKLKKNAGKGSKVLAKKIKKKK